MKKRMPAVFIALAFFALAAAAVAQEDVKVRGTVIRIDAAANSITLKPLQEPEITVVMTDVKQLSKVKVEEQAEVRYVVKDGVNTGIRLRKLIEGCQ